MENQKFTKEKWLLMYPKNSGPFEIHVDGIKSIASVHNNYGNLEEQEANAKLMVTAPELLEALKEMLLIDELDSIAKLKTEVKAIDVIKKATGNSI